MSKQINIVVVRPFYIGGVMQERNAVLEVSDAFGRELMAAGKAAPAPVEQPAEPPVEQPAEPPVEQPAEPPVEQPAEPPVEQPAARKMAAA